jgi:hypothetical protein
MTLSLREAAGQLDRLAMELRREAVRRLRLEGKTFAQIAADLGISRARAHELWVAGQQPVRKKARVAS